MNIRSFCESIKKDYLYFLYKNNDDFPYCCHVSANLLASYLAAHFDKDSLHCRFSNQFKIHGWTESGGLKIDFTGFQFSMIDKKDVELLHKKPKTLSKDDLYAIIEQYCYENPFIEEVFDVSWAGNLKKDDILYGVKFAKEVAREFNDPRTLQAFMRYLETSYKEICKLVKYF